jgi:group I intron endonuclease
MSGVIYVITNLANGKQYVGKTIQKNPKERWYRHCSPHYYKSSLKAAIDKYGKDNFKFEIVDRGETPEELSRKEGFWIDKLDTFKRGYNRTVGGEINRMSDEAKKAISKKMKGRPQYGKKCKPVVCENTGQEFLSHRDAVRHFGIGRNDVYCSIRFKREVNGLKFRNKE